MIAVLGFLVVGLFVALCFFLFVPWVIGATADLVGSSVTRRPLNLGCLGYIVVAILGAILGQALLGNFGPRIFDIHIIPAFVGSIIISIGLSLLMNMNNRGRYR